MAKATFTPEVRDAFEILMTALLKRSKGDWAEFQDYAKEWAQLKREPGNLDHMIESIMDNLGEPMHDYFLHELSLLHDEPKMRRLREAARNNKSIRRSRRLKPRGPSFFCEK